MSYDEVAEKFRGCARGVAQRKGGPGDRRGAQLEDLSEVRTLTALLQETVVLLGGEES